MATRTLYLICSRNSPSQRAHFGIFVPSATNPNIGTYINAVGAPMVGYKLEFERNYNPATDTNHRHYEAVSIGEVDSINIVDSTDTKHEIDSVPRGNIEFAATQVPTPGISENFMAPVNDKTNKRCQEWTMEYIRHLVSRGYIDPEAIDIVHSKRDPPNHGIGLQSAARR